MAPESIQVHYERLGDIATRFGQRAALHEDLARRIKEQAERLIAEGWQGQGAQAFAEITAGRTPILAIGPRAAWLCFQIIPGNPQIALESINTDQLGAHLSSWVAELALEPAS